MEGIEQFRKEAENINTAFPTLFYREEQGQPVITGTIVLQEGDLIIDQYDIRMIPVPQYPNRFPHIFETGGRIPKNIDWHIFPDGHCCIKSYPEELFICKGGLSLQTFFSDQVIPYFFNQKHRELHGFFFHERKHGLEGNIGFFEDQFATKDLKVIGRGLLCLWKGQLPNRTSACFCQSGKKYRHCHKNVLSRLSVYSKEELEGFLKMIQKKLL